MQLTKTKKQISLPKLLIKTQKVFNEYIRLRDADKNCITCGKPKIEHACHFYSAGHYSSVRFSEDNVHGGCLACNYYKHGSGNEYRRNILKRIGQQRLDILDSVATRQAAKKWERYELEILIQEYKQKIKELQ